MSSKVKIAHGAASFALVWCLSISSSQAAELALSDVPLFIKDGVDPNIIVTLDDSGSMQWAYVPDAISGNSATRRFKSSYFNGMYYDPSVTYVPPKNESGVAYTTSFTVAYENGFLTSKGSRNLSSNYRPTLSWNLSTAASSISFANNPTPEFGSSGTVGVNKTTSGVAAYYYEFKGKDSDTKPAGCNAADTLATRRIDDDCYVYKAVTAAEQQNFATWYSFYRNRVLATASAASLAFQSVGDNVRVAYQNLNLCNSFSGSCRDHRNSLSYVTENRIRPFTGSHREGFYRWLQYAASNSGTPLRSAMVRAGTLTRTTDVNSPYAKNPGTQRDPMYACRPAYHIAMTDGIWNTDSISAYGNYDNTSRTTPGGCADNSDSGSCPGYLRKYGAKTYSVTNPFKDTSLNAVADIVFEQWITDAQPSIANQVPVYVPVENDNENTEYWDPRNDPAEWQHLTSFLVAFGLTESMINPAFTGSTFGGDYSAIAAGTKSWPGVGSDDADNPYDLWHAAINGRGMYFSADDPNTLVDSFNKILTGISERTASAASVALDSGVVDGLNFAYHANFSSDGWTGDLKSFELETVCTSTDFCYIDAAEDPTWKAATLLDAKLPSTRNIKMVSGTNLVDFTYTNMSAAQQTALSFNASGNADTKGSDRVNYLRGDRSQEDLSTGFRTRKTVLGDIIHSSPTYVGAPNRYDYDTMEGFSESAANSYESFKSANANRTPLVFVGANDGMLHAFNANTGQEQFAFVPTAAIDNLRHLTYQGYSHKFFVDGPTISGDVYDTTTGAWKTIVIGTLRKGGKSVFALDVTNPNSIKLLWEFSDTNLGYVYGKPAIVRLHNGKWGVLIGNGYNSTNHRAFMYVLDAVKGTVIKSFDTAAGALATPNGLANPSPVDINGDLITDYVYAGDLLGNLWRFDLIDPNEPEDSIKGTSSPARNNVNETKWSIGYSQKALFTAKDDSSLVQPITTGIVASPHPTGKGIIVAFGSGKYLESSDTQKDTSRSQTFYGIWDRYIFEKAQYDTITRSMMQEQTLTTSSLEEFKQVDDNGDVTGTVEQTVRSVSDNAIQWYNLSASDGVVKTYGWYLDFEENGEKQGEMLVTDPLVLGNAVIFATTIPNEDPCAAGIDRWVFGLDIRDGSRTPTAVFDLNEDHQISDLDKDSTAGVNSSVKIEGYGAPSASGESIYLNLDNSITSFLVGSPGNQSRQSWRIFR